MRELLQIYYRHSLKSLKMPINTDFFKIDILTVNHDVTGSSPVGGAKRKVSN
nr:MAG TPA: hypothetical protein [Caudoviricetes sp.]